MFFGGNPYQDPICSCEDGTEATGDACTSFGAEICASCDNGYHLDGTSCSPDPCDEDFIGTGFDKACNVVSGTTCTIPCLYGFDGSDQVITCTAGSFDSHTGPTCIALDTDGDGIFDADDAFPDDPTETTDSDGDGVGDNADVFPNDAHETVDSDGDGVGDNADAFPDDAEESMDTDGDGVGDNADDFPDDPERSANTLTRITDSTGVSAGVVLLILILIGLVIAAPLVWFFFLRKGTTTVEITEEGESA